MKYRIEKDSMGEIKVPMDKYWGAQTQRSFENFKIGDEKMDLSLVYALSILKLACANANYLLKPEKMTERKRSIIDKVVTDKILTGNLDGNFPLSVWQTGSGTQTNMNVNEVIANCGNELADEKLFHPNDDINMSQSSNDVFPSAMHIASVLDVKLKLLPEIKNLVKTFKTLERKNKHIVKSGRTHLQDATPISFGQEISGWRTSLEKDIELLNDAIKHLSFIAIGGTAVGTGLNAPLGFDKTVCKELTEILGVTFKPANNKFHALSSKDEMVFAHGALKSLACDLMKIANDIRWLSSGPRCG
ncbi:MAG: class II fumarate hydratase, partial [Clostridia bacterium]|nr:class II fumarate hydratase [Clostridia bacterium]